MLTTGVDAKNVRNVVLTAPIKSMTEFKQIIGRGTRVFEGKDFFTIIDFVGATNLFYDERWDGIAEPIDDIKPPKESKEKDENSDNKDDITTKEEKPKKEKVTIAIKGKKLKVINIETTYVGVDGKPLRSSEYLELLIGVLGRFYNDEQTLRDIWSNPKNRKEPLEKLKDMNIDESQLEDLKDIFEAKNSDIYDVLAHLSFNHNIKTRDERAIAALNSKFIEKYQNEKAKDFIEFILEKYRKYGFKELEENKLSTLIEQSGFDRRELMASFGDFKIRDEYFELQKEIYR